MASRASSAKVLGLCHSVQGTSHKLAEYAGVPIKEMRWKCGGLNHLAWFTVLEHNGTDLYPALCRKIQQDKTLYELDPVRFDMMLHFGYFVTESSGHFSEYVPFYRKRKELIDMYCRAGYLGETGFYAANWPIWRKNNDDRRNDILAGKQEITYERSWEYASYIIHAIETDSPFIIHTTVPNRHLIENLSHDGVVEVACVADKSGITPTYFGALPPQCAALCESHMRMYDLAATACLEKSRQAAFHALALDPLTSAVCSLAEIKQMTSELFESQRDLLPDFN
jgi:alpha-galactosidase